MNDSEPAHALKGGMIVADQTIGGPIACDMLSLFAGSDPTGFVNLQTVAWPRQNAASGTTIATVSAGPYLQSE